jgi:ribosomal protein L44E
MNEKDFFNEQQEMKRATYSCPFCRERAEYEVRWLTRRKKRELPRGANEQDRARFAKSRDYMVRIDDMLACKNMRCRRRFEIPNSQSVVFI